MKIEYDKEVDSFILEYRKKRYRTQKELEEGINLDMDDEGKIIGLEIIGATEKYNLKDIFNISTENLILRRTNQKLVK